MPEVQVVPKGVQAGINCAKKMTQGATEKVAQTAGKSVNEVSSTAADAIKAAVSPQIKRCPTAHRVPDTPTEAKQVLKLFEETINKSATEKPVRVFMSNYSW